MKKRILAIFLMMTLFISVAAPMSFAASGKTKKQTVYNDVIKVGNNVYCYAGDYIYKVNIKSGKKTKLCTPTKWYSVFMRYNKGYIYYITSRYSNSNKYCPWNAILWRVNVKTKKVQKVYTAIETFDDLKYAIKGSKIYTQYEKPYNQDLDCKNVRKSMKLNGKSKKSSKYKIKMTRKNSNAKGYSLILDLREFDEDDESGYVTYYLKTPKKKIKICRYFADWED